MKNSYSILKIVFSIIIFLGNIQNVQAGEIETAVAETITAEYLKEQLKYRAADYLNKHPEIVNSTSTTIGTDSIRIVGQSLALYGLATARNDHDRAWNATYLFVSPEPTTALVLVAVQLVDTCLAMKSQARLAEIYAEIAEINAKTTQIYRQITEAESAVQKKYFDDFYESLNSLNNIQKNMDLDPVYLFLNNKLQVIPTEKELVSTLQTQADLGILLDKLDRLSIQINFILKNAPLVVGEVKVDERIKKINQEFDVVRVNNTELNNRIKYFFAIVQGKNIRSQVQNELSKYATDLRIYKKCAQSVNEAMMDHSSKLVSVTTYDQANLIQQCQKRFKNFGNLEL